MSITEGKDFYGAKETELEANSGLWALYIYKAQSPEYIQLRLTSHANLYEVGYGDINEIWEL